MVDYNKKITAREAVRQVIDDMPIHSEISGLELKKRCVKLNPKLRNTYVETFLRSMRYTRRYQMICVNKAKSTYRKIGEAKKV